MIYELHLTVDAFDTREWITACTDIGVKPLLIRLSAGKHVDQIMCAARVPAKNWDFVLGYAKELESIFHEYGFPTRRIKVEIPISKADVWARSTGLFPVYAEAHYNVDASADPSRVIDYSEEHSLGVSHSSLKGNWWLTWRSRDPIPPDEQMKAFDSLSRHMQIKGINLATYHSESVIFDNNVALDEGWL
jgi:hypothetical protein